MKRRDFLRRATFVTLGALIKPLDAAAQALPFGFWKSQVSAITGTLRTTQAMFLVGAIGGASSEMRNSQANLLVSSSGSENMRIAQVNLLASAHHTNGQMNVTQTMLLTSAGNSSSAPMQSSQVSLVASSSGTTELLTTQAVMLVAAKP